MSRSGNVTTRDQNVGIVSEIGVFLRAGLTIGRPHSRMSGEVTQANDWRRFRTPFPIFSRPCFLGSHILS